MLAIRPHSPPTGGDAASPSDPAAVAAVLSAPDHYAALGAGRDVDLPELRCCYLGAGALVHPDRNTHPGATEAFQRLGSAWHVLRDAGRRSAYDRQLAAQDGGTGGDGSEGQGPLPADFGEEPDAFAAFASAANLGDPSDMRRDGEASGMEELAHRLAGGQGYAEACAWSYLGQLGGVPPATLVPESSPARDAAVGVALSLGGYVAGTGLRTLGFKSSGQMIQRCALLQLASQVTSALQVEEVRDSLADCAGRAHDVAGNLSRQANGYAEWMSCPQLPCLPRGAFDTDSDAETEFSHTSIGEQWPRRGAWVRIKGLRQASHLNGRVGEVVGTDNETGRAIVQLFPPLSPLHAAAAADSSRQEMVGSGSTGAAPQEIVKSVKVENLEPAAEQTALPPRDALHFI